MNIGDIFRAESAPTPASVTQAELIAAGSDAAAATLIKKGMDLEVKDKYGNTLLTWALAQSMTKLALRLIECGANPNAPGENRELPLRLAAGMGHADCVEALIKAGAPVEAYKDGLNALMRATNFEKIDTMRVLLKHGANIEAQSLGSRRTPLILAAADGRMESLEELISKGAAVDAIDSKGMSAFMVSIGANRMDPARRLLKAGADINRQNDDGLNALMYVGSQQGMGEESTRELLSLGAKTDLQNKKGETALMIAIASGKDGSALALIEHHADRNLQDNEGTTPLMRAIQNGRHDIVRALIDKGIQANLRNEKGETALFFAARKGDADLVQELLAHGADPLATDNSGATALDHTRSAGRVRDMLEELENNIRATREKALTEGSTILDKPIRLGQALKLKRPGPAV